MIICVSAAIYTVSQYSVDHGESLVSSTGETQCKEVQCGAGLCEVSQAANGQCSKTSSFTDKIVKPASEGKCRYCRYLLCFDLCDCLNFMVLCMHACCIIVTWEGEPGEIES